MLETATTRAPRRRASRIAWIVSIVSPLWETPIDEGPDLDDRVAVAELARDVDVASRPRPAARWRTWPTSAAWYDVPAATRRRA